MKKKNTGDVNNNKILATNMTTVQNNFISKPNNNSETK